MKHASYATLIALVPLSLGHTLTNIPLTRVNISKEDGSTTILISRSLGSLTVMIAPSHLRRDIVSSPLRWSGQSVRGTASTSHDLLMLIAIHQN